jgi:hypothetical protein
MFKEETQLLCRDVLILKYDAPLRRWLAFAGIMGKLDAVRQRFRWRFRGIQEVHLAFWQHESGRR